MPTISRDPLGASASRPATRPGSISAAAISATRPTPFDGRGAVSPRLAAIPASNAGLCAASARRTGGPIPRGRDTTLATHAGTYRLQLPDLPGLKTPLMALPDPSLVALGTAADPLPCGPTRPAGPVAGTWLGTTKASPHLDNSSAPAANSWGSPPGARADNDDAEASGFSKSAACRRLSRKPSSDSAAARTASGREIASASARRSQRLAPKSDLASGRRRSSVSRAGRSRPSSHSVTENSTHVILPHGGFREPKSEP